jgi:hypothetical protein
MITVKPTETRQAAIEAAKPGFWESAKAWGWKALSGAASSAASSVMTGLTSAMFGETIGTGGGQWGNSMVPYRNS